MTDTLGDKPKLTEQDFNLITQARDEFNGKLYDNCLKTLELLENSMGANPKLSSNKAVVEFYKSEMRNYKALLKFLDNDKLLQISQTSEESKYIPPDAFNRAVIFYHQRKPFAAIECLTPLLEKLEYIDETLAPRAGLLMLSLLLITNQVKKAYNFLKTFQDHLGVSLDVITAEDNSSPECLSNIDGFKKMFKLLSMLTLVINKKIVIVPDDGSTEYFILKAHQYYVGKDFQMAAKQLSRKFNSVPFSALINGEDQDTCIANNMGIIHLRVRHYAIAATFFQHAISFDNKVTTNLTNTPLHCIGATKKPEILYNLGIAMLHLERPKEAFECFLVPLKIYHNNPRLWLRVAEACIMFEEKVKKETEKKTVISSVIGSGVHRKFVLEPSAKIRVAVDGQSFAIPNPNFEFASLCLRNAVTLVEYYRTKFYQSTNGEQKDNESWFEISDQNCCNPSMPVSKESFNELIASVYASYSYVSIRLGDFTIALEYGKKLLSLENLSGASIFLGKLYCAESLIMLNRVTNARKQLDPFDIADLNPHDFETKNWEINSITAGETVIRYNLAISFALSGEFEKAKSLVELCTHPVVATKVKMLQTYIQMAMGSKFLQIPNS